MHFAVRNREIQMSTRLYGPISRLVVQAGRGKFAIDQFTSRNGESSAPCGPSAARCAIWNAPRWVQRPESDPDPNLQGDICEACKHSDDEILRVANTVQTGVDQPLPCGREVNRRRDGILTLQTLSRLIHALQQPMKETAEIGGDSLICMVTIR
ncbi:MAG: hypothetical protein ACK550_09500 [Synechococcaceae cyanobacterium]